MTTPTLKSNGFVVLSLLIFSSAFTSCTTFEPNQLVPSITLSPAQLSLAERYSGNNSQGVDFGITTSVNESDSLTNIVVLPGVRVRSVISNLPADIAGIRSGDIILSIDNTDTNHPDVIERLAQHTDTERQFKFRIRRNTAILEATVTARPVSDERLVPKELYRADPIASRAGYETEILQIAGQTSTISARVVDIFPDSPLPQADIRIGDQIIAVNGNPVHSAQGLINSFINDYELGERVSVTLIRNAQLIEENLRLWTPGRRLSRLSLGPIVNYESSLDPDSSKFSLLDLWLFSLFSYSRTEGERQYSLFSILRFNTGYGELTETTYP